MSVFVTAHTSFPAVGWLPVSEPVSTMGLIAVLIFAIVFVLAWSGHLDAWLQQLRRWRTGRAARKAARRLGMDWEADQQGPGGFASQTSGRPTVLTTRFSRAGVREPKPIVELSVRLAKPWDELELWLPDSNYARRGEGTVLEETTDGAYRLAGARTDRFEKQLADPELLDSLRQARSGVHDLKIGPESLVVELAGVTDPDRIVAAARLIHRLARDLEEATSSDDGFVLEFGDDEAERQPAPREVEIESEQEEHPG